MKITMEIPDDMIPKKKGQCALELELDIFNGEICQISAYDDLFSDFYGLVEFEKVEDTEC